jgi:lysozyme
MKIRKNGKIVNLTESDLRRIVKRVMNEGKYVIKEYDSRKDGTTIKASQNFWDWLRWHEGDSKKKGEPKHKAYRDSVGVWTIGYGHTGKEAYEGNTISKDKANSLLIDDVNNAAQCIKRILKQWKEDDREGYKLNGNEYEALISLVFNSGCQGVRNSSFIQKIKSGKYDEAATMILDYKSDGLENRRNAEYELFKNGKYLRE